MDLWQLHIFCKIVDLRSFSKAGDAVNLSQPTVSSHIRYLEDHFGCRLLDRMGKEVLPTKAGELLYSYARRLLKIRDEVESAIASFQGAVKGRIVVGGSTIPGNYLLPRLIGPFITEHPAATVSIRIGDTQKIIDEILSGEVEFGVVGAATEDKRISQEVLVADEMRLIVRADHPLARKRQVSLEMLAEAPFIVREKGSGTLKTVKKRLEEKGYRLDKLQIVAEMGSTTAVCEGIKSGIGLSILSPIAVEPELKSGVLTSLAIKGLNLKRNFYLTRYRQRTPSPLGELLIRFLRQRAASFQ